MSDIQRKIREINRMMFNDWMWENYFWYELMTIILILSGMVGIITSIICMIWVAFWWWKIGLTSLLLIFVTRAVYKILMPSFYEEYRLRK